MAWTKLSCHKYDYIMKKNIKMKCDIKTCSWTHSKNDNKIGNVSHGPNQASKRNTNIIRERNLKIWLWVIICSLYDQYHHWYNPNMSQCWKTMAKMTIIWTLYNICYIWQQTESYVHKLNLLILKHKYSRIANSIPYLPMPWPRESFPM